jgi:hypothetical protein
MISRFGGRIKVPVAASRWNHVPRHVRACRLHAGQHGGEKLFFACAGAIVASRLV